MVPSFRGFVSGSGTKWLADLPSGSPAPLSPPAHFCLPRLRRWVAHTQGGITLSLEEGELDADFCPLGAYGVQVEPGLSLTYDRRKLTRTQLQQPYED